MTLLPSVFLAAVYGGCCRGALGIILIVTLSLFAHDSLVRLDAVKGMLSLVVATVTVVHFKSAPPSTGSRPDCWRPPRSSAGTSAHGWPAARPMPCCAGRGAARGLPVPVRRVADCPT
ncbi:MAG TPA: hypothetical protein VD903_17745 [Pseudonocardia sp.]|nr:hypothetical protein [Pseudonocardia sp.]